jgi:malonate transporter and related proteins
MDVALAILPNFLLILIGFALSRRFDYGRGFWDGLEKLVYYVLFPALLFRSLATAQIDLAKTGIVVGAALAFTVAGMVLALPARRLFNLEKTLAASCFQCAFRFNTYVGLAVAGSLLGQPGLALAALVFGAMIPLVNLAAVAMLASGSGRGVGAELVRNPLLISTLAGFVWNALGLPLPGFADQTLNLLAQTSLPAGLLSVGAALRIERGQGPVQAHAYWLAVKLLALPAMALGLARLLGFGPLEAAVLIIAAALPTASSAYILAVRMGGTGGAVATQITAGTLISMVTLPIWVALAGIGTK